MIDELTDETAAVTNGAGTNGADWHQTACILCECNCGIEVRLGGEDGRRFERIRGDKAHPASKGYTCEKALRLDHYQNGRHRLTSPLRRRPDGTFEEIDWDTAISRGRRRASPQVRDTHGGESIFYYGGGGQGNHLGGAYSGATMRALGGRYRSNALAQEKTGEFWVNAQLLGHDGPRRLRARRGRAVHRQEPVAVARLAPRPHHAQGDRPRSRPRADRHRSPAQRDGRAGRLPPGRSGRAPTRGAWPRWWPCSCRRAWSPRSWLDEHTTGRADDRGRPSAPCPSPSTRRCAASTRNCCGRRPAASPGRRASPPSRTSASR